MIMYVHTHEHANIHKHTHAHDEIVTGYSRESYLYIYLIQGVSKGLYTNTYQILYTYIIIGYQMYVPDVDIL
jgi:hypothetical protein